MAHGGGDAAAAAAEAAALVQSALDANAARDARTMNNVCALRRRLGRGEEIAGGELLAAVATLRDGAALLAAHRAQLSLHASHGDGTRSVEGCVVVKALANLTTDGSPAQYALTLADGTVLLRFSVASGAYAVLTGEALGMQLMKLEGGALVKVYHESGAPADKSDRFLLQAITYVVTEDWDAFSSTHSLAAAASLDAIHTGVDAPDGLGWTQTWCALLDSLVGERGAGAGVGAAAGAGAADDPFFGEAVGAELFTGAQGEIVPEEYENLAAAAVAADLPRPQLEPNVDVPSLVAEDARLRLAAIVDQLKHEVVILKPRESTRDILQHVATFAMPYLTYSRSQRCRRHEAWLTGAQLGPFYDMVDRDLSATTGRRGATFAMYMCVRHWEELETFVVDALHQMEKHMADGAETEGEGEGSVSAV